MQHKWVGMCLHFDYELIIIHWMCREMRKLIYSIFVWVRDMESTIFIHVFIVC